MKFEVVRGLWISLLVQCRTRRASKHCRCRRRVKGALCCRRCRNRARRCTQFQALARVSDISPPRFPPALIGIRSGNRFRTCQDHTEVRCQAGAGCESTATDPMIRERSTRSLDRSVSRVRSAISHTLRRAVGTDSTSARAWPPLRLANLCSTNWR